MYNIDTSALIDMWELYDPELFPHLWEWFSTRIKSGDFSLAECAFEECGKIPELRKWLKDQKVIKHPRVDAIRRYEAIIHKELNLESYIYGDGVGENDIIIISTAKHLSCTLVSTEKIQRQLPGKLENYRIPTVCSLACVKVKCINLSELIDEFKNEIKTFLPRKKSSPKEKIPSAGQGVMEFTEGDRSPIDEVESAATGE